MVEVLDARVGIKPMEKLKISLSATNALDRQYFQYYKTEGRTIFGEAEFKL